MEQEIIKLYKKGFNNPSAITSILFQNKMGDGNRFMELRKIVEITIQKERSKQ